MKKIAVVGSFGRDYIMQVSHIPARGETVGEGKFSQVFGGKGANQALAAARAGSDVNFIACVGSDDSGTRGKASFKAEGINTEFMTQTDAEATGTALIFVGDDGENSITVAPGANYHLNRQRIDDAEQAIKAADLILMQLEIPLDTVEYVLEKSQSWNIPVMLNPAPAKPLTDAVLQRLKILVLNETEAELIGGESLESADAVGRIAANLQKKGPQIVILTLGARGAYVVSPEFNGEVPGNKVEAIDTTAAGDVFCGALVCALGSDMKLEEAVKFANAAAAIAVTRIGAQPSVPYKKEIIDFLT